MTATFLPLRLNPGEDLRPSLRDRAAAAGATSAFVVSGIGSLTQARLRYAGAGAETVIEGPLEILSLGGTLADNGAHLHMAVSDATGRVFGGHVGLGNIVRTTAEVLLATLPGWQLTREMDAATGYPELQVKARDTGNGGA